LFGLGAITAGLTLLVGPKNFLVDVKVKKLVNLSLDFISSKGKGSTSVSVLLL